MKKILFLIFLVSSLMVKAQSPEFEAAARAFENDEPAKALSLLSQLQLKTGPNPRIESLRALAYDQQGDKEKAYNSTLLYFKMAGRDNTDEGNKDMLTLETSLKKALQSEMDQKKKSMEQQWAQQNDEMIQPKYAALQTAAANAQQTSDAHFNKLITRQELTADDINLIKANIKTEAAQKLDPDVLKINTIKFSNMLALGGSIEPLIDPLYNSAVEYIKSDEYLRELIKKEKRFKFKKEEDYHTYLAGLKNDLRSYFMESNYDRRHALDNVMSTKYMLGMYDMKIACPLPDLSPIIGNNQGYVRGSEINPENGKIASISASKILADAIRNFSNRGVFDLQYVGEIKKILEAKYGVVKEVVVKRNEERNYAKYIDYEYIYTIETKTLKYTLNFHFGPYGYEGAVSDRIDGSTLRGIYVDLIKKSN